MDIGITLPPTADAWKVVQRAEAYRGVYLRCEPEDARYLALHAGHLMFLRPEEQRFISAELMKSLTLTGTPDAIKERVAALEAAGYNQLAIQITTGHEHALEDWARLLIR